MMAGAGRARGSASLGEIIGEFSRLNTMVMDRMNQAVMDALEPVVAGAERRPRPMRRPGKRFEDDCCDSCQRDDCACRCCIGDADLVIYARLGEVRIIPIRIENTRRRERTINLEFSGWTTRGGRKVPVQTQIQPDGEFNLPACSEREVRLRVDVQQAPTGDQPDSTNRLPDVDDCMVLYGDLRVEGCEIRPVRIALALLPLDCDPYVIECGCTCC
jgi:hypothetical protein